MVVEWVLCFERIEISFSKFTIQLYHPLVLAALYFVLCDPPSRPWV